MRRLEHYGREIAAIDAYLEAVAIAVKNMDARRRVALLKQRLQISLAPGNLSR